MSYDNYYTTKEVAQLLGLTPQGVTYKRITKKLKAIRPGRDFLYPKKQFKDLYIYNGTDFDRVLKD